MVRANQPVQRRLPVEHTHGMSDSPNLESAAKDLAPPEELMAPLGRALYMALALESVIRDVICRLDPAVVTSQPRRSDLGHKTFPALVDQIKRVAYWRDDPELLAWVVSLEQSVVDRESLAHSRPPLAEMQGEDGPTVRDRRRGVLAATPKGLGNTAERLARVATQGRRLLDRPSDVENRRTGQIDLSQRSSR